MIDQNTIPEPNIKEDEIDIIALVKTAWEGRRTIIKTTFVFIAIGLFIAIFTPKQYSVTSIMVPQTGSGQSKLGGLSSIAAMAGFNLNMNSGPELSPVVYPQIVQSIPFQIELMSTKLNFEGYKEKISLYDYYTDPQYRKFNMLGFIKKYTIGLPGTIIGAIIGVIRGDEEDTKEVEYLSEVDDSIIQLTSKERSLTNRLSSSVFLNVNQKDGTISFTAIMPEAKAAAQLGQKAQVLLQQKIIEFKIEKAQDQLNFVEELFLEKKNAFEQTQRSLAQFRDRNKNVSTAMARTEEERLQSEYQIAQSVYNELAKQLENTRIQVKEETPVFSIIKPISIPKRYSSPNRKQILIIWIVFGLISGIGWVFGKSFFPILKEKWKNP